MKTNGKIFIGFLIIFLMISCALESKFSLPNDEKINPELIGKWYFAENNKETISVQKNSDETYKIILKEDQETKELISYSKTIKGFNIMNIITESNGKITNVFYGFYVQGNILTYSEVNDKLHNQDFESESKLLQFLRRILTDMIFSSIKLF